MAIYKQLIEAMSEFQTLPKDKSGYGYKYTDCDTVVSYVRPILTKHGLGYIQPIVTENEKTALKTILFNAEGEQIVSVVALPEVAMAKTNAAQNLGASITYMKRYALCAILGISADEDTDAVLPSPAKTAPKITDAQKAQLKKLLESPLFSAAEKQNYRQSFKEGESAEALISGITAELKRRQSAGGQNGNKTT